MVQHSVLVVDDHSIFQGWAQAVLAAEPDLLVTGCSSEESWSIGRTLAAAPNVIIMDLNPPIMSGLEDMRALKRAFPNTNVLIYTASSLPGHLFAALSAGARGYILKDAESPELVRAVFQVAEGGVIFSPGVATRLLGIMSLAAQAGLGLTGREHEVLALLAKGSSNRTIGDLLGLSVNTVKTHLRHIMNKLSASNRKEAAAFGPLGYRRSS